MNFTLEGDSADVDINQLSGTCVSASNVITTLIQVSLDITSDNAVIQINQKDSDVILNLLFIGGVTCDPLET